MFLPRCSELPGCCRLGLVLRSGSFLHCYSRSHFPKGTDGLRLACLTANVLFVANGLHVLLLRDFSSVFVVVDVVVFGLVFVSEHWGYACAETRQEGSCAEDQSLLGLD